MDVFEEIFKRQEFENNGIEYDLELKDGIFQAIVKDPDPSFLESIGEGLERVAGTTASIGAGAVGATLGFPTDLASLFASIGKSVGAEDGKKLETFANTFETLSRENYGSQFYKKYFDSFVDDLNVSDQKKEDFKSGFVAGEFLGVGNVGKEAAKQAPTVAKSIKETSEQVGEAAQKRVDENQGSMTMSSMGVGEMGKMVDKGLSKLAPNKGEVVNLKPKTDRLNFYSKAEEVTNQLKQNKGTGQQYRQQLLKAGVKPDEIEWLGLDDVLNKGKITKQELQDQINANRIELDEVELSGSADDALDGLASRFNENETPMSAEDAYGPEYLNNRADEIFEEIEKGQPSALLKAQRVSGDKKEFTIDDTYKQAEAEYNYNPIMKYVDPETGYTITGNDDLGYSIFRSEADSSNLRNAIGYNESNPSQSRDVPYSLNEAVIKAEEDMMDRGVAGMAGEGTRFGEYTEPGGDNYREFLIKYDDPKVQFDESHFDEENVIAHFRTKDRTTSDGKKVFYIEEIQSDWGQKGRQRGFKQSEEEMREISNKRKQAQTKLDKYIKQVQDSGEDLAGKDLDEATALRMYLQQTQNFVIDNDQKVFKAPFITDTDKWTQLTLKRILSKAVDEGYDFVSITPGKAQMDRWNDEGVAKFYDEIVPKNAEKIVKKLDKNAIQKDKEIGIEGSTGYGSDTALYAEKRFSIELTPQLKEKVKKGMAMFSATPLIVGQENE